MRKEEERGGKELSREKIGLAGGKCRKVAGDTLERSRARLHGLLACVEPSVH